ncbi:MAG: hypothetical protein JXM79_01355, partial [Sedimentisphaerales bacterium]|nr:hypothetical protein [Sedimentisphaerales bacterium]
KGLCTRFLSASTVIAIINGREAQNVAKNQKTPGRRLCLCTKSGGSLKRSLGMPFPYHPFDFAQDRPQSLRL